MTPFQTEMQERKALWSRLRAIGKMKGDYHYYPLPKLREVTEKCESDFEDESNLLHLVAVDDFKRKDMLDYADTLTLYGSGGDMRAEIAKYWEYMYMPSESIVFRGTGNKREVWHVAPIRASVIRTGAYLLAEYYAAPYSPLWGDFADRSRWGFDAADGEWLDIN